MKKGKCYYCKRAFNYQDLHNICDFDEDGRWCQMTLCKDHVAKAETFYKLNRKVSADAKEL